MQTKRAFWSGVGALAVWSLLGCSNTHEVERQPPAPQAQAPAPAPAPEAPAAPAPAPTACAGICYHALPTGGCETMPTCCPRTVHLKVPPHCPEGYTLDLNSGPERCAVHNLCVD
jgi:hypothetical protein